GLFGIVGIPVNQTIGAGGNTQQQRRNRLSYATRLCGGVIQRSLGPGGVEIETAGLVAAGRNALLAIGPELHSGLDRMRAGDFLERRADGMQVSRPEIGAESRTLIASDIDLREATKGFGNRVVIRRREPQR